MKNPVLRRHKGMVLVIVIVAIMLMSIVVVGILSRHVSMSLGDEKEIQRLQAEFLAKGCFWLSYQSGGVPASCTETVGPTTYTVTYTTGASGPGGTTEFITHVDY